jgi:DNA-binding NtrC family response regulator
MVLLITAFGSIDLAVESVRAGAVDFLAKPFRLEVLVLAIRRALRERHMRREIVRLRAAVSRDTPSGLAASSRSMQRVVDLARRAAKSPLPVLITGESGGPPWRAPSRSLAGHTSLADQSSEWW